MTPRIFLSALALALFSSTFALVAAEPSAVVISSPDGRLAARVILTAEGGLRYTVTVSGQQVLAESRLGLVRDDEDFTRGLKLVSAGDAERVVDRYEILTAKRRQNTYVANRRVLRVQSSAGKRLEVTFQVSDDGVAFRYAFPDSSAERRKLLEEITSYRFPVDSRAWLQPMSAAKTGWKRTNPSYEEYYLKDIPVGTASPTGAGWVYPALFRNGTTWMLVSETGLSSSYCGTRLRSASPDGEYTVGFPDERESFDGGAVAPESTLPWVTPWRILVVGSLKTIAESTLGIDLAEKPALSPSVPPQPGKASWSWPLMGDDKTVYEVQRRFIDYAAEMHWGYCLIDALWDTQIGYEKMKELADYAKTKNVRLLVWYNSAGKWNEAPQTPRDLMTSHESRIREFERLRSIGIAGLKIDFFGGDGQSMIAYYQDILKDAAPYGFLINFHGSTLPRGWQRTYPHLMTMEAIRGLEFITFEQANADHEPTHATTIPFTRNVFDPMDFTPVVLDRINDRIQRRTTSAFELALSVVFTSGIQHYAEIPEGMAKVPNYVRDFLRSVPSVWDDTKFVDGFPGKFVVLARLGEGKWYVAGLNSEPEAKSLSLDLAALGIRGKGVLIQDADERNLTFAQQSVAVTEAKPLLEITIPPNGGFVAILEPSP